MKWRKVKPESHYQRRRRAKKKRRKILEEVQNTYCIKSINAKNKLPWIMPSSAKSLSIKSTPKNKLFHDGNIISEYNFVMQTPI